MFSGTALALMWTLIAMLGGLSGVVFVLGLKAGL
jgi:hypothetical protein